MSHMFCAFTFEFTVFILAQTSLLAALWLIFLYDLVFPVRLCLGNTCSSLTGFVPLACTQSEY